jgi:hypothetical protein
MLYLSVCLDSLCVHQNFHFFYIYTLADRSRESAHLGTYSVALALLCVYAPPSRILRVIEDVGFQPIHDYLTTHHDNQHNSEYTW